MALLPRDAFTGDSRRTGHQARSGSDIARVDAAAVIQAQRIASLSHLENLRSAKYAGGDPQGSAELAWLLVVDSMIFTAEAEVRWLDHTEQRLARHPHHAMGLELATERPKRGRPTTVSADAQPAHGERKVGSVHGRILG